MLKGIALFLILASLNLNADCVERTNVNKLIQIDNQIISNANRKASAYSNISTLRLQQVAVWSNAYRKERAENTGYQIKAGIFEFVAIAVTVIFAVRSVK